MTKKTLKADALSPSSIRKLQDDLEKYKNDLTRKCRLLAERLAEIGINVAKAKINESPLRRYISIRVDITEEEAGCKAILIATGENQESEGYAPFNTLLAIEFGAGIRYNPIPNPNEADFGLGVGTFPNQTHAFNKDGWWFFDEAKDKWVHSYGVRATMPMHEASMEIQKQIAKIAREVFE